MPITISATLVTHSFANSVFYLLSGLCLLVTSLRIFTFWIRSQEQQDGDVPQGAEAPSDATDLSPELLIKHPLQNKWALWYFKNDKTKEWTANLKLITTFDTVEDFWAWVLLLPQWSIERQYVFHLSNFEILNVKVTLSFILLWP